MPRRARAVAAGLALATLASAQDGGAPPDARPDPPAGAANDASNAHAPDTRREIHGKSYGDTLGFPTAQTDFTLTDAIVDASPRTALIFYDKVGPHRGTTLRNVLIRVAPGTLPLDRSYWALRGYDMVDTLLDHVEITGFGVVTDRHDEGHAIYVNPAGDFTLTDSYIHHNGGQGLQLVDRPSETTMGKGPMPGTITVRRTRFVENGFNPNRGAFQVSIFGTGQDVVLEDVEIVAGLDDTVWPKGKTGGGIVMEPEPYAPNRKKFPWWRPDDPPADFVPPFTQGVTTLTRVTVRHRDPDRALVQIKGCRELVVKDCTFEAVDARPVDEPGDGQGNGPGRDHPVAHAHARIELDAPTKPGRTCGKIVWQGNHGNCEVWQNGRRIGLVSDDFTIDADGTVSTSAAR